MVTICFFVIWIESTCMLHSAILSCTHFPVCTASSLIPFKRFSFWNMSLDLPRWLETNELDGLWGYEIGPRFPFPWSRLVHFFAFEVFGLGALLCSTGQGFIKLAVLQRTNMPTYPSLKGMNRHELKNQVKSDITWYHYRITIGHTCHTCHTSTWNFWIRSKHGPFFGTTWLRPHWGEATGSCERKSTFRS